MSATMLDIARRGREHNLLILPATRDGSKFAQSYPLYRTPDGRTTWRSVGNTPLPRDDGKGQQYGWKVFRDEPPDEAMLRLMLSGPEVTGVVYICGQASGGLEMWETEDDETWQRVATAMEAAGLGPVWKRMTDGLHEVTPGGGHHTYSRCAVFEGNLELARRPRENGKVQILIESRGEGGLSVAAPSHGTVHPSGRPYELISGGMETIATITPDERAAMLAVFRSFDEMPAAEPRAVTPRAARPDTAGLLPGDDFNARGDWETDVLTPAGWTFVREVGTRRHYRHPDTKAKWSGNVRDDLLYVFTSSTVLEKERAYSKFVAYTALFHAGDFHASASALAALGYGEQTPRLVWPTQAETPAAGDMAAEAERCPALVAEVVRLTGLLDQRDRQIDRLRADNDEQRAIILGIRAVMANTELKPAERITAIAVAFVVASRARDRAAVDPGTGEVDPTVPIFIGHLSDKKKADGEAISPNSLAAAVGATPNAAGRNLHKLEEAGILRVEARKVPVIEVDENGKTTRHLRDETRVLHCLPAGASATARVSELLTISAAAVKPESAPRHGNPKHFESIPERCPKCGQKLTLHCDNPACDFTMAIGLAHQDGGHRYVESLAHQDGGPAPTPLERQDRLRQIHPKPPTQRPLTEPRPSATPTLCACGRLLATHFGDGRAWCAPCIEGRKGGYRGLVELQEPYPAGASSAAGG